MHPQFFLVLTVFTAYLNALPLNINLGAYSPALVVGDGEISFGGKQDVSNLMNALEGAAVSGAAANGAAAAAPAAAATQPAIAPAAQPAAAVVQPGSDQATQITSLQGMGKEIAPRIVQLVKDASTSTLEKRDIAGFNAALNYATGALKTSPEVQLGTGEGGSGVGITQKAGGAAPATSAVPAKPAAAAREVLEKREESVGPKMKTTVTTMFVRGGSAPAVVGTLPLPISF
jgi:hypothetical protein